MTISAEMSLTSWYTTAFLVFFAHCLLATARAQLIHAKTDVSPYQHNINIEALKEWMTTQGSEVHKVDVQFDGPGQRSLVTKQPIKKGEAIMTIHASNILNVGASDGGFLTPVLFLLREMLHPDSRFGPYLATLPPWDPTRLINACTLGLRFAPLLQSPHWEKLVNDWQYYLQASIDGKVNAQLEWTPPEVLGMAARNLTLQDVQYACALSATRYVVAEDRLRLLMLPLFDMANHSPQCTNYMMPYVKDELKLIAGSDLEAGQQVCFWYGDMKDDHALIHYGFLPPKQDPPRLLMVDSHQFSTNGSIFEIDEERFSDTDTVAVTAEVDRLQAILGDLEEKDSQAALDPYRPVQGQHPLVDMLLELQQRRREALRWEIDSLKGVLSEQVQSNNSTSHAYSGAPATRARQGVKPADSHGPHSHRPMTARDETEL